DRVFEALFPGCERTPAEFRLSLYRVDRITAIVAKTVGDIFDQRVRFAEGVEERGDHLKVAALVACTDVIYLAGAAVLIRQPDGTAMVIDVDPIADVLPVAVDRKRLVVHRVGDHQRDQLFGKLPRAVVVPAAGDDGLDAVRFAGRSDDQLGSCL